MSPNFLFYISLVHPPTTFALLCLPAIVLLCILLERSPSCICLLQHLPASSLVNVPPTCTSYIPLLLLLLLCIPVMIVHDPPTFHPTAPSYVPPPTSDSHVVLMHSSIVFPFYISPPTCASYIALPHALRLSSISPSYIIFLHSPRISHFNPPPSHIPSHIPHTWSAIAFLFYINLKPPSSVASDAPLLALHLFFDNAILQLHACLHLHVYGMVWYTHMTYTHGIRHAAYGTCTSSA